MPLVYQDRAAARAGRTTGRRTAALWPRDRRLRPHYRAMKARGVVFEGEPATMPYGTGVMLQDLYGNKLYLNEDGL